MIERTAALALHYQNDVLHPEGRITLCVYGDDARHNLVTAARRYLVLARKAGLPIIHVRIAFPQDYQGVLTNAPIFDNVVKSGAVVEGSWGSAFFAGLEPLEAEPVVTHHRVNGFYDSPLEMVLRPLHVSRLIVAGVATNSVVEHTARHAADAGYNVVIAADACSAARRDVHEAALFNLSLVGEVSSLDQIFSEDGR
jgi:nicotinamidase-related amidase